MAVTIDTRTDAAAANSQTTRSISITVAANSNRCLVLGTVWFSDGGQTVTGVAYTAGSGGTWTKAIGAVNTQASVELWYSTGPSTGAVTVEITYSSSTSDRTTSLWSVYDVDQTTPLGSTSGVTATNTCTVNTTANDMAFYAASSFSNNINPWSTGTNDANSIYNIYGALGRNTGSPTSSAVLNTSSNTAICGAAILVAAAGPATTLMGQIWM